jgi:DNA-binding NarL/FixJ family response regulator
MPVPESVHKSIVDSFNRISTPGAISAKQLYGTRILNQRELQVIALVAQGLKNSEVAEAIGTTEYVVKNQLRAIYDKLGLWNRVELALWYEARRREGQAA